MADQTKQTSAAREAERNLDAEKDDDWKTIRVTLRPKQNTED